MFKKSNNTDELYVSDWVLLVASNKSLDSTDLKKNKAIIA